MSKEYKCHKISEGYAEGEIVLSNDDLMFYLIEPDTGVVIEKAHDLNGKTIAKKIISFPSGKGSSVVQADGMFQLMKRDNAPLAMIVERPETVLVTSAILFEVPMVDKVDPEFYKNVKDGDTIIVDANNERITIK